MLTNQNAREDEAIAVVTRGAISKPGEAITVPVEAVAVTERVVDNSQRRSTRKKSDPNNYRDFVFY